MKSSLVEDGICITWPTIWWSPTTKAAVKNQNMLLQCQHQRQSKNAAFFL